MHKQITFTSPDTQPSLLSCVASSATIDLETGAVNLVVRMCDADGPVKAFAASFTMDTGELGDLADQLLADAQEAGQLPAGTIS